MTFVDGRILYASELNQLAQRSELDAVTGSNGGGIERRLYGLALQETIVSAVSSTAMVVDEFRSLITDRPDVNDPSTWDWAPAYQAAIDASTQYHTIIVNGSTYVNCIGIRVPGIMTKIKAGLSVVRHGSGTGTTFQTCLAFIGDNRNSSVIQTAAPNIDVLTATNVSLFFSNIGFREGSNGCRGIVLGDSTIWEPVSKVVVRDCLFAGFKNPILGKHVFDSVFENVYVTGIGAPSGADSHSAGIYFPAFTGLDNGGLPDSSNHISINNCQFETMATGSNAVRIEGVTKAQPHHHIRITNCHLETHNRNVTPVVVSKARELVWRDNDIAQNGSESVDPVRVVDITDCWGVDFSGGKIITNNEKGAVVAGGEALVHISGDVMAVIFRSVYYGHFYRGLSPQNLNMAHAINFSSANAGKMSVKHEECRMNDVSFRAFNDRLGRIVSTENIARGFDAYVTTDTKLAFTYSQNIGGTAPDTDIAWLDNVGNFTTLASFNGVSLNTSAGVSTGANIIVGGQSSVAASKSVDFTTNGDKTTVMGQLFVDTVGRVYLNAIQNTYGFVVSSLGLIPKAANTHNLGSLTVPFKSGWFSDSAFIAGNVVGSKVVVPSTATSTGALGQWAADASFFYVCTATNTWRRVTITAW